MLAPHNLKPLPERVQFYDNLEDAVAQVSSNGPKLILGDLNARIGQKRPGEESILGDFRFGREATHRVELPNRDLLLELCCNLGYIVANSLLPNPAQNQVTYHEPVARPMDPIRIDRFNVLDRLLIPSHDARRLISPTSDRHAAIASHHFPVTSVLNVQLQAESAKGKKPPKKNWAALQDSQTRSQLVSDFKGALKQSGEQSINSRWQAMCEAMQGALELNVPKSKLFRKKPWISDRTLELRADLSEARCEDC